MTEELLLRVYRSVRARLSAMLLLVLGFFLLIQDSNIIKQFEYFSIDLRFELRSIWDKPAHEDIVLLGVSEQCLPIYGRWPWDRNVHGRLMKELAPHEPSVVSVDLIFTE